MSEHDGESRNYRWWYRDGVLIVRCEGCETLFMGPSAKSSGSVLAKLSKAVKMGGDVYSWVIEMYLGGLLQGAIAARRGDTVFRHLGKRK